MNAAANGAPGFNAPTNFSIANLNSRSWLESDSATKNIVPMPHRGRRDRLNRSAHRTTVFWRTASRASKSLYRGFAARISQYGSQSGENLLTSLFNQFTLARPRSSNVISLQNGN